MNAVSARRDPSEGMHSRVKSFIGTNVMPSTLSVFDTFMDLSAAVQDRDNETAADQIALEHRRLVIVEGRNVLGDDVAFKSKALAPTFFASPALSNS